MVPHCPSNTLIEINYADKYLVQRPRLLFVRTGTMHTGLICYLSHCVLLCGENKHCVHCTQTPVPCIIQLIQSLIITRVLYSYVLYIPTNVLVYIVQRQTVAVVFSYRKLLLFWLILSTHRQEKIAIDYLPQNGHIFYTSHSYAGIQIAGVQSNRPTFRIVFG